MRCVCGERPSDRLTYVKLADANLAMMRLMTSLRSKLRLAAFAGLTAMLFSQAALALVACNLQGGMALAMTAPAEAPAPCHQEEPANDPLCVAHCQASAQTLDKHQAKVPVLPARLLPVLPAPIVYRSVSLPPEREPAASPPVRILFQSLLI